MDYQSPPPDDADLPAILAELTGRAGSPDAAVRRDAMEGIYELAFKVRSKAATAIPTLMGGLVDTDPKVGDSALWALYYCAPDSIQPLIECLSHPLAFVRERAAHSLGNVGDSARAAAAPILRGLLADIDQAVRTRAAWALGLMHDAGDETVRRLVDMVKSDSPADSAAALHALGNIGKSAGSAFLAPHGQLILGSLESARMDCRLKALYALESIGLDAQTWADTLVNVVQRDDSSEVRSAALACLKGLTPSVNLESALPTLITRLTQPAREASLTCEILKGMRPRPMTAVPYLKGVLSRDELVLPAASALWSIEGRADAIIPALRSAFEDNGEGVCDLICDLGPAASPLIPEVLDALAEENWDLQWAAADALRAIASSDQGVLQSLLGALSHPSPIVRSASARALGAAGTVAVRPLMDLLPDAADPRASLAAYALGEMGSIAAEALPALHVGMRGSPEPLAGCCAIAVVRIAGDPSAVPFLEATLRNDDPVAPRQAAAEALAELGPAAAAAEGALEALIHDDDLDVADAARQAISAIRSSTH